MLLPYEPGRSSAPSCAQGLYGRVYVLASKGKLMTVCSVKFFEKRLEEDRFAQNNLGCPVTISYS